MELYLFEAHLHGKLILIKCQALGNIINSYLLHTFGCFLMLQCFPPRKHVGNAPQILEKAHLKLNFKLF